ncbi:MAG: permease [Clostridium sp.]
MTAFFYTLAFILLIISSIKSREKTKSALKVAWKSFEAIMPQFLSIVLIIGFILAIINTETISKIIGNDSGIFGIALSSVVGSITIMPTFVAFSTGNSLLLNGAGYAQVGALISTLTMVGVVTYPLESKYIGKKAAFLRNFIAFIFSFVVALLLGKVMSLL